MTEFTFYARAITRLVFYFSVFSVAYPSFSEPVLSWTITAFDQTGSVTREFHHSSHASTKQQVSVLCDPAYASRFPFPPASSIRVVVRPSSNALDADRQRIVELSCAELLEDSRAFDKRISPPPNPKGKIIKNPNYFWMD